MNSFLRLFLSSGTSPIEGVDPDIDPNMKHCYRGGFVTSAPWRPVTGAELELLQMRRVPTHCFDTISIFKMPPALLQESRRLGVDQLTSQAEARKYDSDKKYLAFMEKLLHFLEAYIITDNDFEIKGLRCCNILGLKGATYDHVDGKLPGLHIDSWDTRPWSTRKEARNRICINLGKESRYFLFVNLNISTVVDMIAGHEIVDYPNPKRNSAFNIFFELYPDYPIVKVELEPGEFYIAPTENILHDAMTEGKTVPDISLTILGYFNVSSLF